MIFLEYKIYFLHFYQNWIIFLIFYFYARFEKLFIFFILLL